MNNPVKDTELIHTIFSATEKEFTRLAIAIFNFQYQHNQLYKKYCDTLQVKPALVKYITQIPFLPIGFFKSHPIVSTAFEPEAVFESSGTTQTINSKHLVKNLGIYRQSFTKAFQHFYGAPADWCIIALLPSYLERGNSSLVVMANELIEQSGHKNSGFYLKEYSRLHALLTELEAQKQKTLLIGVSFALLDFAEQFPHPLSHTCIMETGGMKGRREEMPRQQVHSILCNAFHQSTIHSEYGMTELLSQAYSKGYGLFCTPPWMKILIREEDDPFAIAASTTHTISGAINVIDLANLYSCSFIATEDAGRLHADGSFEVLGRIDNTDIRGCSLMVV